MAVLVAVFGLLAQLAVDTASGQEKQDIHKEVLPDTTDATGRNYILGFHFA